MKRNLVSFACAAVFIALILAPRLRATTVVPMSVEELTARAQLVMEGRAVEQWSQWDNAEHLIYTYTRFAVSRRLKGASADTVVVRQMGGSAGGYTQVVSGVRYWNPGDEAVLFLRPSVANDGSLAVVGLMQGNYRVVYAADGTAAVTNGVASASVIRQGTATTFTGSRMALSELEQRVRRAVQ